MLKKREEVETPHRICAPHVTMDWFYGEKARLGMTVGISGSNHTGRVRVPNSEVQEADKQNRRKRRRRKRKVFNRSSSNER